MIWIASWSAAVVATWANRRSRSWRSDRSEVSTMTSASLADRLEDLALAFDRAGDAAAVAERVAVPGLAEPPDQDVVARLEEHEAGLDAAALRARRARRRGPAARHRLGHRARSRPARTACGPRDELRELGQELAGQVVHDEVAEVLEQLSPPRLAATRQPAEDDDGLLVRRWREGGRGRVVDRSSRRPSSAGAPDEPDRDLEQHVHRAAEDERADEVPARRGDGGEDRECRG
jgi:hypothetical protein